MHHLQSLPWADPLHYAAAIEGAEWALLYSGVQAGYSGRFSLLAFDVAERVSASGFKAMEQKLTISQHRFTNAWFGYFGYGLKNNVESLPKDKPGWLKLPPLNFLRFHTILEFDHKTKTVQAWSSRENPALPTPIHDAPAILPRVSKPLTSNMTRDTYLAHAQNLIGKIHAGDLYQANLTRKFGGTFDETPNPFDVFRKLCTISPAAYSAFFKLGNTAIISSSPELFLHIGPGGNVRARPVKGTSPRFKEAAQDEASKQKLQYSDKDRAENLMIVDLMRNDLARSCNPGSVKVEKLYEVTSHSNVHHMSSTITGRMRNNSSPLRVIAKAFPPGSMTGAPKIMAMQTLSAMERDDRGVYSGALGWLGGDGSVELSVVIRTLLLRGPRFEFQVGGGIVADSTPEGELQEIADKASGIMRLLELDPTTIP